jgi:hypothetical protein
MFKNIINKSTILLQTGENIAGYNHLKYWIPEFLKSKVKFIILVRNIDLFRKIKDDFRMCDILYAHSALDVEEVLSKLQSLKTIFHMSNSGNNIHILRFNKYKHIFIGTENFDRDAQVTKMLKAYDELWLTSQASIDKISKQIDISDLTIKKIGKPQLNHLMVEKKEPNSFLYLLPNDDKLFDLNILKLIIEYISEKNFTISFVVAKNLKISNKFLADFQKQLNEFALIQGLNYKIYNELTDDLLIANQNIICDLYNYNQKFLASNNIVYIYKPNDISIETVFKDKYISFDGFYSFSSVDELIYILNNDDNMKEIREEFIEYWIGNESMFDAKLKEII